MSGDVYDLVVDEVVRGDRFGTGVIVTVLANDGELAKIYLHKQQAFRLAELLNECLRHCQPVPAA